MSSFVINPDQVRDISGLLLDADGSIRVTPAATFKATTAEERLLFGVRHGIYGFPTGELIAFLRQRIDGRSAIEIGAGHGILAAALGIPATDNRQQEAPAIRDHYRLIGQPTIRYGNHVEQLDAASAVMKYRPRVVIASWVTHRYDATQPHAGGSDTGIDEASIIASCDEYVFIGNEHVHAHKPIWALPHRRFIPDWLYSRAANGSRDLIASWTRSQAFSSFE